MSKSTLAEAYRQVGIPLDQLPYSDAFAKLRSIVKRLSGEQIDKRSLWRQLLNLRKEGKLPRLCR